MNRRPKTILVVDGGGRVSVLVAKKHMMHYSQSTLKTIIYIIEKISGIEIWRDSMEISRFCIA